MRPRLRQISETAETLESHMSLANRILDWPWAWIAGVIMASGGGWLAWLIQKAFEAPWYTQVFFSLLAALVIAFIWTGIVAFWVSIRRSRREEGAIASGLAWSGYTYGPGAVIDGGTHHLSEIFGADQIRNNLLFRNSRIEGPGIVAFISCTVDKTEFFDLPKVQFIDPKSAGNAAMVSPQFVKCRFENCAFAKALYIMDLGMKGPDIITYQLKPK